MEKEPLPEMPITTESGASSRMGDSSPSPFARSGRELVGGPSPIFYDRPGR
ncbi:MAG: hypothetical protein WCP58_09690 [bacterium]